jgi:RimJ/RimL family protein N-acetyltransferase
VGKIGSLIKAILPIETERLLIREILPGDEQGMFELDSDNQVHQYLGENPFTDIQQTRELIIFIQRQYAECGIGRWAVIQKKDGAFVGWTGFRFIPETINKHSNYYDFGYRLCSRFWGQGYATESGKAALQYGLQSLQLKDVYAMTHPDNMASRKVLEKIGFNYTGLFPFDCPVYANWRPLGESVTWFELPA